MNIVFKLHVLLILLAMSCIYVQPCDDEDEAAAPEGVVVREVQTDGDTVASERPPSEAAPLRDRASALVAALERSPAPSPEAAGGDDSLSFPSAAIGRAFVPVDRALIPAGDAIARFRHVALAAAAASGIRAAADTALLLEAPPLAPHPTGVPLRRPIIVVSGDGGGVRGVRPATILAEIDRRLRGRFGLKLVDVVDVWAGTSTSSGIVGYLAASIGREGMSAERLAGLYTAENSARIFNASFGYNLCNLWGLIGPRFPSTGLEAVLREYIPGDLWLSDLRTNVLIPAVNLDTGGIKYFRSDRARAEPEEDYLVIDASHSSASAPTFLPSHTVTSRTGRRTVCVDGGVQINNPTKAAYDMARELYPGAEIFVLSLGTGERNTVPNPAALRRAGLAAWARPIIDLAMSGSSHRTDQEMHALLPDPEPGSAELPHYLRSQSIIGPDLANMASTDARVIEAVRRTGDPEHNPDVEATINIFMQIIERGFLGIAVAPPAPGGAMGGGSA